MAFDFFRWRLTPPRTARRSAMWTRAFEETGNSFLMRYNEMPRPSCWLCLLRAVAWSIMLLHYLHFLARYFLTSLTPCERCLGIRCKFHCDNLICLVIQDPDFMLEAVGRNFWRKPKGLSLSVSIFHWTPSECIVALNLKAPRVLKRANRSLRPWA